MRIKTIDIDKVQQWIDDLKNYDYDNMRMNFQKYHGDLPPCDREAMIEKCKVINEGKILAYQNLIDYVNAGLF